MTKLSSTFFSVTVKYLIIHPKAYWNQHYVYKGEGTESGIRWGAEKEKQCRYSFLHVDIQAVIKVYVPVATVSGGDGERQGFELRG